MSGAGTTLGFGDNLLYSDEPVGLLGSVRERATNEEKVLTLETDKLGEGAGYRREGTGTVGPWAGSWS
jgi:hypothetical protein